MPFTAQEVIEAARGTHTSFDAHRTTDTQALSRLNQYVRQLTFKTVEKDSSALTATVEQVTLPLADFAAGHTMPAYVYVHGGTVYLAGSIEGEEALNLVPYRNRFTPNTYSAAYIHGGVLYLCGDPEDWSGVDHIDVSYTAEPTRMTALTDTVPLPDGAFYPCSEMLAYFMARRQGVYEGVPLNTADFLMALRDAENEYLVEIAQHSRPETAYYREEW